MADLTKAQILARKTGRGKATLPDGSTVSIRALTRDEVIAMQAHEDLMERDTALIAMGMTNPTMTVDEVAAWAAAGDAGDLVAVSDGIAILSGLKQGAGKSSVSATGE